MQVHFPPELEGKLNRIAAEQGKNSEALVCEAVAGLVGYDEWFVREVEKGTAAADRSEFIEHAEVLAMIDQRYPDRRSWTDAPSMDATRRPGSQRYLRLRG